MPAEAPVTSTHFPSALLIMRRAMLQLAARAFKRRRRAAMRSGSVSHRSAMPRGYFGNMNCTCTRSCQFAASSGRTTL